MFHPSVFYHVRGSQEHAIFGLQWMRGSGSWTINSVYIGIEVSVVLLLRVPLCFFSSMSEPIVFEFSNAPSQNMSVHVLILEEFLNCIILIIQPVVLHSFLLTKDMGSSVLENNSELVNVSVTGGQPLI